jgi:YggT family protein
VGIIFEIFSRLLNIYVVILFLRSLASWVRIDPYDNPIMQFLYAITEPILGPIRAMLPQNGMIDFSPLVAVILVIALQGVLSILATGR